MKTLRSLHQVGRKRFTYRFIPLSLCLSFCLFASALFAHPTPKGLTTIERNPNTNTVEIVHRFHLHDAEEAMQVILSEADLTLDALEGRAQLALHVEETFQLADGETNVPLSLVLVGAEIKGENVLVFQEYTDGLPPLVKVRHDALRDAFPEQVNTLNAKLGSRVQTLVFRDSNKWKTLKQ